MHTNHKNRILADLAKPFHPTHVEWRPGAMTGDKKKAIALAYADLRSYQNRLDEVCSMEWSVSYTPWGVNRIICHLTICGITRSSTGEADSAAERSEIAGTAAEAQAFKRACSMFQLGRYLYNLPSVWVEYDPQTKVFTPSAQSRLTGIIVQHHQRYLATVQGDAEPTTGSPLGPVLPSANEDATTANDASEPGPEGGSLLGATTTLDALAEEPAVDTLDLNTLHADINRTGKELFGNQWIVARSWLVESWTAKHTANARLKVEELDVAESEKVLTGMVQHAAPLQAEWKKHLANEALTTMPPTATKRTVAHREPSGRVSAQQQLSPRRAAANGTPRERF